MRTWFRLPDGSSAPTIDVVERFINKIDVLENSCWQWTDKIPRDGYGRFYIDGKLFLPHRFSYLLYNGELDKELVIDHLCGNRGCVNPEHLEQVTQKENVYRGKGFAAQNIKRTVCPRGHPYDAVAPKGYRMCMICVRVYHRINYRKRRDAKK